MSVALIEAIFEFVFDIIFELALDERISRWIRYPLLVIVLAFIATVIIGLVVLGLLITNDNLFAGILLFALGVLLGILFFFKAKKYIAAKRR